MIKRYFLLLGTLITFLTACSQDDSEGITKNGSITVDHSLENLQYHKGKNAWSPDVAEFFSQEGTEEIREAYENAIHHPEVLSYMPCYCGCYEQGHESNRDCFVDQDQNGTVVLDNMGFG
ncbi:uncharacterized protein with PCYCGC motif [Melghiribacillus thermohalophilus]|uniref:Uncharacterized protein with PCYCGC motif n=2 Tax=Melghiribacillus thermohalophilus TaxID=1324956 RepID=A0A4V2V0Y6_9BACI|nr:uncharacterized protein with PCYCGC motif [Melghiribacillus thermohalophilus]